MSDEAAAYLIQFSQTKKNHGGCPLQHPFFLSYLTEGFNNTERGKPNIA
jgi:hypothetical protein